MRLSIVHAIFEESPLGGDSPHGDPSLPGDGGDGVGVYSTSGVERLDTSGVENCKH